MRRMKKFCMFTKDQNETLIELVAQNPALYDPSNPSYKDIVLRDRTWTRIGKAVDRNAEDCKTRWRSIRDLYHKKMKVYKGLWCSDTTKARGDYTDQMAFMNDYYVERKSSRKENNESEEASTRPELEPKLNVSSMAKLKGKNPAEEESEILPCSTQSVHSSDDQKCFDCIDLVNTDLEKRSKVGDLPLPPTKRRKEERDELIRDILCIAKRGRHPTKMFFDSMALTVMNFPPSLQAEAKLKVCQVVTQIESHLAAKSEASNKMNQC